MSKLKYMGLLVVGLPLLLAPIAHADSGTVTVSADRPSNYIISIPKQIELINDQADSDIRIYGDFANDDIVEVEVSKTFTLQQTNKSDVTANVTTYVNSNEATEASIVTKMFDLIGYTDASSPYTIDFHIETPDKLTAGNWTGNLGLRVKLDKRYTYDIVADMQSALSL